MIDYHLHLWRHDEPARPVTAGDVRAVWDAARAAGVGEIAVTEHLSRFRQGLEAARGFWEADPDAGMRDLAARYWQTEATADLDQYVEALLAARAEGIPLAIGLEVDHAPGRVDAVSALLAGYPFDVLLGSVHWIGGWGFDILDDPRAVREWDARRIDDVWDRYVQDVEDLAAAGTCDVLAHVDLVKLTGGRPDLLDPFHDRLAVAASQAGVAVEVSSAGLRKPVGEIYPAPGLLARLHAAGVPVTTASDAHRAGDVARDFDAVRAALDAAGYEAVTTFRARKPSPLALVAS